MNEDLELCIKEWIQVFIDAWELYYEWYVRKQVEEQYPWILTATENVNGVPWGIYHKMDIYPTESAKLEALKL